jgi:HD-GYP domain-containing protein (c-di-GMP phosphodiesterase class II)
VAVDPDDAVTELRAVAGSQLDPEVVGVLLGVLAESVRALA